MSLAQEGGTFASAVGVWLIADPRPALTPGGALGDPDALTATLLIALLAITSATLWHVERERRRVARLQARLAFVERRASTTLLAPHFLLNTLNAVTGLVRDDALEAERMLCTMGDLLRSALRQDGSYAVPLRDELGLAREYLTLMEFRWRERLHVDVDIPADSMDAAVPALVLQPLLENALRHGITSARSPRIEIRARREHGMLTLEVCDNGPGLPHDEAGSLRDGIGLAATKSRLSAMFGDAHRVELRNRVPAGVVASVVIPYRPAGSPDHSGSPVGGGNADSHDHRRRRADCA